MLALAGGCSAGPCQRVWCWPLPEGVVLALAGWCGAGPCRTGALLALAGRAQCWPGALPFFPCPITSTYSCLLHALHHCFWLCGAGSQQYSPDTDSDGQQSRSTDESDSDTLTSASSILDPTAVYPPSGAPKVCGMGRPPCDPNAEGPMWRLVCVYVCVCACVCVCVCARKVSLASRHHTDLKVRCYTRMAQTPGSPAKSHPDLRAEGGIGDACVAGIM